jgi:hypothetical protein
MAAVKEARTQLERRSAALREYHDQGGHAVQEVVMDLYEALRAKGLSREELKGEGISYASVEKILRTAKS